MCEWSKSWICFNLISGESKWLDSIGPFLVASTIVILPYWWYFNFCLTVMACCCTLGLFGLNSYIKWFLKVFLVVHIQKFYLRGVRVDSFFSSLADLVPIKIWKRWFRVGCLTPLQWSIDWRRAQKLIETKSEN